MFIRFDRIHERDRQTDRRKDAARRLCLFLFLTVIVIIIIIIIIKPSKNEGREKIEKVKKNGEANVPSGRPTQNYCATKQN